MFIVTPRGFATSFDLVTHACTVVGSIDWNSLEEKLNNGIPALLGKVNINWFAVNIWICLHLSECHICIFCPITIVVSMLVFTKSVRKRMLRWQGKKMKWEIFNYNKCYTCVIHPYPCSQEPSFHAYVPDPLHMIASEYQNQCSYNIIACFCFPLIFYSTCRKNIPMTCM